MKNKLHLVIIVFLSISCIQFKPVTTQPGVHKKFPYHVKTTKSFPISELNETINYDKNKINLVADYESYFDEHIILYLINDSDEVVEIPAMGGDINIEYEVFFDDSWKRAKKYQSMYCGHSAHTISIPGKHFILVKGYFSKEGNKVQVRYKLYDKNYSITSNIGTGHVNSSMIEFAKYDGISLSYGSFDFIKSIINGQLIPDRQIESIRRSAIWQLQRFDPDSSIKILRNILYSKNLNIDDFKSAFDVLNRISPIENLAYTKQKIYDDDFQHRSALFKVVNDFTREEYYNTEPYLEKNKRKYALRDSLLKRSTIVISSNRSRLKKSGKTPAIKPLWLKDSTLHSYIKKQIFEYDDPSINNFIKIYCYFNNPDTKNFLNSLAHNYDIPKELRNLGSGLIRHHFDNDKFLIDFKFTVIDTIQKINGFPLFLEVYNISDEKIEFTKHNIFDGLFLSLNIKGKNQSYNFDKNDFELTDNQFDTIIINRNESKTIQLSLRRNEVLTSLKKMKVTYSIRGSLLLDSIHDIPNYSINRSGLFSN